MGKNLVFILLVCFLAASCVSPAPKPIAQEYWILKEVKSYHPMDLLSHDSAVRDAAVKAFNAMDDESKLRVSTYLIYTLAEEPDAHVRLDTINTVRVLAPGSAAAGPLLKAFANARSTAAKKEISRFLREFDASKYNLNDLREAMSTDDWDTRYEAMRAMARMGKKAAYGLPEIWLAMKDAGPSFGIYSDCYELSAAIDRDTALAKVMLDLQSPDEHLRGNGFGVLFNIYSAEPSKTKLPKDIFKSLERSLYSPYPELVAMALYQLGRLDDPAAATAVRNFNGLETVKTESMKKLAFKKIYDRIADEEEDVRAQVRIFLEGIGRPAEYDRIR